MASEHDEIMEVIKQHVLLHGLSLAAKVTGEPMDDLLSTDPKEIMVRVGSWVKTTLFGDDLRKKVYKVMSDAKLDELREETLKTLSFIHAERERREKTTR